MPRMTLAIKTRASLLPYKRNWLGWAIRDDETSYVNICMSNGG